MIKAFADIAEQRIQEDIRQGGFENLEGAGKPLKLDDDAMVRPELRMAYKILKNGGWLPAEIQEEREIQSMLDLIEGLKDEREKYRQIQKLNFLVTKINLRRNRPINLEKSQYYQDVVEKIQVSGNTSAQAPNPKSRD